MILPRRGRTARRAWERTSCSNAAGGSCWSSAGTAAHGACPAGRLRRGESEARGIARELFEETGLRLPEAAFTRVRVVDDADRIASYQDGTVWRMVIVLFRAQLPQEPELHCSRESCTLRFFTPEELRTADLVPTHRDLIEAWRPAPLEVAAAMLTRGQTVLLCRRPEGKARALQWEFPGGKLEPGETGEQRWRANAARSSMQRSASARAWTNWCSTIRISRSI